ncbi:MULTISPECIES: ABC transporter ATP-binding protein [Streptomyces]|uniref:ABC transporter ATP-binding protein n=1 Tax=Streptomyces TaxID=1883 RepID=UPI001D1509C7|nr:MULTISPECIES: ATP-binding cassette domain-containing protein [Streptomyces]MCC3655396.1 ATP-binding cassette domain-containing protein [Streptomyces sp. S07_1.15]WSQ70289.1 ATP-binding cassette domain-containing protein [Streptomyces xinghaiensis]
MTSIDLTDLTKEYGGTRAVDRLTCSIAPGRVTGFLGPNGAGKSTTMRLVLGLDHPTAGTATVGGRPYRTLHEPLRTVGALLDAQAAHGSRTARDHLRFLAAGNRIPARRIDEVLRETGLSTAARRRIRTFSLGMRQRLGIAAALLGDPPVLLLDEPANGLDPEGIVWIRELLRRLAREGRTVLVSSHLMNETATFADHLVVLGRGRLLADLPLRDFIDRHSRARVRVRTGDPIRLRAALLAGGHLVTGDGDGGWMVEDTTAEEVGAVAARAGVPVSGLTDERASLEQAYLALTTDETEFAAAASPSPAAVREA